MRMASDAIAPRHRVIVAMPEVSLERLADIRVETLSLGAGRAETDEKHHFSLRKQSAGREEIAMLRGAIDHSQADRALHLFADGAIRPLLTEDDLPTPLSVLLFRPRAHYPRAFGSRLTPRDWIIGRAYEVAVAMWRRRRDALRLLTLDEVAAIRWAARPGAPALWLPDTPPRLASRTNRAVQRAGCAIVGSLAPRKGIELLADALELTRPGMRVILAGEVVESYRAQLIRTVERMISAGAEVELRDEFQRLEEYEGILASVQCVVLTYRRHYGMSRVLVEAALAGTPIVADEWGLIGHLVREYGLGKTVDAADARALSAALNQFCDGDAAAPFAPRLAQFASRYSWAAFVDAISDGLALPATTRDSGETQ
jgi:hypothetical protein